MAMLPAARPGDLSHCSELLENPAGMTSFAGRVCSAELPALAVLHCGFDNAGRSFRFCDGRCATPLQAATPVASRHIAPRPVRPRPAALRRGIWPRRF